MLPHVVHMYVDNHIANLTPQAALIDVNRYNVTLPPQDNPVNIDPQRGATSRTCHYEKRKPVWHKYYNF